MEQPAACGIATLGIDHEAFLLVPEDGVPAEPMVRIAFEKAGIARRGSPLVTQSYPEALELEIERRARQAGARLHYARLRLVGRVGETIAYHDRHGEPDPALPQLPGATRATTPRSRWPCCATRTGVGVRSAMAEGIRSPLAGALQLLGQGPLTALAPGREVWLDGGHNADAGLASAATFAGQRLHS
jgi:dihydrofolate synthase/folylpolyglutamate synthase